MKIKKIVLECDGDLRITVNPELGSSSWQDKQGTLEIAPSHELMEACRALIEALTEEDDLFE